MNGSRSGAAIVGEPPGTVSDPGCDPAAAEARAAALVKRSGTSFYWGMRLLPADKRAAMYAIYAFCREVDDVADEGGTPEEKLVALNGWRDEIEALYRGRPGHPTTLALLEPVARFDLPKAEFLRMIDGMEMDARERMRAPGMAELERYCRAVAGTVGLLSMSVFGQRGGDLDRGGLALAEALQLTNILRDLEEDAGRGRLYLPRELLLQYGIEADSPIEAIRHPALNGVCRALAARAEKCFAQADRLLARGDRDQLRPALVMMHVYRRLLERLRKLDWQRLDRRVRLGRLERLWLGVRYGWF